MLRLIVTCVLRFAART